MPTSVVYVGGFDAVELEIAPNVWREVKQGDTLEVPDALAVGLLEQPDNWRKPVKEPKSAK